MNDSLRRKLDGYKTPENVKELIQNSRIIFTVGVTAAGKDTLVHKLHETGKYHRIISHTTRDPRYNHGILEQDGIDYHFVDFKAVEAMLDNGGFVEAKQFSGNVYGTSVAEIKMAHDEGKIAITDIEVQGVAEYKSFADNVVAVFLLPPDFATWQKRMQGRYEGGKVDPQDMRKRMRTAIAELEEAFKKPYFEYVVNDNIDLTVRIVDDLAHGKFSQKKNRQAKMVAEHLLEQLHQHLS